MNKINTLTPLSDFFYYLQYLTIISPENWTYFGKRIGSMKTHLPSTIKFIIEVEHRNIIEFI